MSTDPLDNPNLDESERAYLEMQKLFEDMSFGERMRRMFHGLKMPKDSGEYKFARLQLQRLSGPAVAVAVPLITVIILLLLPRREMGIQVGVGKNPDSLLAHLRKRRGSRRHLLTFCASHRHIGDLSRVAVAPQ